ncbi:MAG: hypothetical protein MUC64_08470 [Rubritepida sp.]|nr:hypothetical protein [Rubritepida sp.]
MPARIWLACIFAMGRGTFGDGGCGRRVYAAGDATDVAIVTSFGPCTLSGFSVFTDEVVG